MSAKPRYRYDPSSGEYLPAAESRSMENPATPLSDPAAWLTDVFGGNTVSGHAVSERSAASFSTVYACVNVIAETMAQLPLEVKERNGRSARDARDNYLWRLLHDAPNSEMTSYDWRLSRWFRKMLWGNTYDFLSFDRAGRVQEIIPLMSDRTRADRINGELRYQTITVDGEQLILQPAEVIHEMGVSFDGINGLSPIRVNREAISSGIATRDFGTKVFSSGFLNGVIEHPGHFESDQAFNQFTQRWGKTYSGTSNAGKTAVLERGMKFTNIGMPASDAQYIEGRKYNRAEIAAIFRVPLSMIQDLEYSGVRANIEQQDTNFAKHTVSPQAVCSEQQLQRKLFVTDNERDNLIIKYDLDELMRGDSNARAEYYSKGIFAGYFKRSYAAEKEGVPLSEADYEALDPYLAPVNMVNATMMQDIAAPDTIEAQPEDEPAPQRDSVPASLLRSIEACAAKILEREAAGLKRIAKASDNPQAFANKAGELLKQQEQYIARNLSPFVEILHELSSVSHGTIADITARYRAGFLELREFDTTGVAAFSQARQFAIIEATA